MSGGSYSRDTSVSVAKYTTCTAGFYCLVGQLLHIPFLLKKLMHQLENNIFMIEFFQLQKQE